MQTGQTGARGTRSTFERKSLPNDRGASARLTRGPECTALIKGRLESRSLPFLLNRTAVEETEFLNAVDKTGKSLEMMLRIVLEEARLGLAEGEAKYDDFEKRRAEKARLLSAMG